MNVLVVTDIAARGIDIPSLDYVINFHFPGKPKLFIHRVGRCARAGRSGTAFSIFSTDDEAHMLDLHLFLNRPFDAKNSKTVGVCPPELVEEEHQLILRQLNDSDITNIFRVSNNAYKAYIQTRPAASVESNKKVKNIKFSTLRTLEDFQSKGDKKAEIGEDGIDPDEFKASLLDQMKEYKAKTTIFELNPKLNSQQFLVMNNKRKVHEDKIAKHHLKQEDLAKESQIIQRSDDDDYSNDDGGEGPDENKRRRKKKKKGKSFEPSEMRDKDFYVPYQPTDKVTEEGFAINSFARDAQKAEFTVANDTNDGQRMYRTLQKWDRKKKKMVNVEDPKAGKMRTEHGVWIAASYKTDRYSKWKERSKIDEQVDREADSDNEEMKPQMRKGHPHTHWGRHNAKVDQMKRIDPELKNKEQLMKQRVRKERMQSRELASKQRNEQKRKKAMSKKAGKAKSKSKK